MCHSATAASDSASRLANGGGSCGAIRESNPEQEQRFASRLRNCGRLNKSLVAGAAAMPPLTPFERLFILLSPAGTRSPYFQQTARPPQN